VRTPQWRLSSRYGAVFVVALAAGVSAVNGLAPSGATPLGRSAATAAPAGQRAWELHDHWRPGRRGDDESAVGAPGSQEWEDEEGVVDDGSSSAVGQSGVVWAAPAPLPAGSPPDRHVLVVLSPHPDDETLSFGVWIAEAAARGDRVIVISLTDGRSTGAIETVSTRLGRDLTRDDIAEARIRELQQAAVQLGVAPSDVYRARLDADGTPGGSRVTVPEAAAVIRAFAARFPQATFATMSWIAEKHPDHLDAGQALHEAVLAGTVHDARFAISRLWWNLPAPNETDVVPTSAAVRAKVAAAAEAYELWDPSHQRYSVGWLSVRHQFTSLIADPRTRLHGLPPTPSP
jgi:LmbE family N-acetylglucosaminyl deacetylase